MRRLLFSLSGALESSSWRITLYTFTKQRLLPTEAATTLRLAQFKHSQRKSLGNVNTFQFHSPHHHMGQLCLGALVEIPSSWDFCLVFNFIWRKPYMFPLEFKLLKAKNYSFLWFPPLVLYTVFLASSLHGNRFYYKFSNQFFLKSFNIFHFKFFLFDLFALIFTPSSHFFSNPSTAYISVVFLFVIYFS